MRTTIIIFSTLTLLMCSLVTAETSVRDLNPPARVTGCLGKPLGTRMIIDGVFARALLANPLKVSETDGRTLKQPVVIMIRGEVQIRKGTRYRLEGYESGEFGGPPMWLTGDILPQQPFQFYSFFVVTKVIALKPE
ncbi:MAG: hypothetical protein HY301_08035 [Verrucomicrobia bacterium]|nr:hypothetical protein [Verrucomicrobiota bacterium]